MTKVTLAQGALLFVLSAYGQETHFGRKKQFFRISRQLIVSISSVEKSTRLFRGRMKVSLKPACPHEATVSRGRVSDFVRWLDGQLLPDCQKSFEVMKDSKNIGVLIFFLSVATVLMCICTFSCWPRMGSLMADKLVFMLMFDIPLGLLAVYGDYLIISFVHERKKRQGRRIAADLSLTILFMIAGWP